MASFISLEYQKYFEHINVDRSGWMLCKTGPTDVSVFCFEVPPLLLSRSDNVQMQKHRHLLRFKGRVEQRMNTNVAGPYLSV